MIPSIGILVAMKEELAALRKLFNLDWTGPGNFFSGKVGPIRLQVALSGAGPERAREAAGKLARYGEPRLLMSAGFAGALFDELSVGEMVFGSKAESGKPDKPGLAGDQSLLERYGDGLPGVSGPILSLDRVIVSGEEKRKASEQHRDCIAVDMETYALAEAAHEKGLPWCALRVISDSLHEDLPLDFNRYLKKDGQADVARIAVAAISNPKTGIRLARFGKQTLQARTQLATQIQKFLGVVAQS